MAKISGIIIYVNYSKSGINLIVHEPLTGRNGIIVALALGLGFGLGSVPEVLSQMPEWVKLLFGESGIVVASMVAFILNIILPQEAAAEKADAAGKASSING